MDIFVAQGSDQLGPFNEDEIRAKLDAGELTPDDHYFHEGMSEWTPLAKLAQPTPPVATPELPAILPTAEAATAPATAETGVPEKLQKDIDDLVEELDHSLGSNMLSIVLYGGIIKNKAVKDTDPVNVMVVVREITTKILDQVARPYLMSRRTSQIQLLTLSKQDLLSSTDVFPIKFLDMQQDYKIARGEDFVADLVITRDHLRLRCEQEMKNLMLRLRQAYLANSKHPKRLSGVMLKAYSTFLSAGDVLGELSTGKEFRSAEEILTAVQGLGLNIAPFRRIQALRDGQLFTDPAEQKAVFEQLMATVRQSAAMADRL